MAKKSKNPRIRLKVFMLVFLLVFLSGVVMASWAKNEYDTARNDTIQEIEESGGTVASEEDIEFNASEEELDHINILLVGLDNNDGSARTDTIMIGKYHPGKGKARLVSIMRDTYVSIPGYSDNKINASYAFGGLDLLRETIEENFDFPVHYYAQVDFEGFTRIVDTLAPDGITVDVENRMYYNDEAGSLTIDFQQGEQLMDGSSALKYVRFRNDSDNDHGRVRRQQDVMNILQDELMSVSGIRRIPQLLGAIDPFIQTNLGNQKMISYGRDYFTSSVNEIKTLTIPVEDGFYNEYYSHAGSVLKLDLEKNKAALHEFLSVDESYVEDEADNENGIDSQASNYSN